MPASLKHLTDKKLNLTSLLARWEDGLYYTAAIVKCDKANKRCLVCFEDSSEVWVKNRDVHIQLTLDQLNEDEDIVCCICDEGNSEPPNEIILCDVCQQGYHQKCHNPPVDSSTIDESEESSDHKDWFCATCSYILNQSNRAKLGASAQSSTQKASPQPKPKQQQQQTPPPSTKATPPPSSQQQKQQQPKQQPVPPTATQTRQAAQTQQQQKQSVKVKQDSPASQSNQKSTIGPVKTNTTNVQKQAPYYPLSNQVRVVATSSTAALASMTASSALVVGSSAGRSKQDLVNQSNRSSQRQQRQTPPGSNAEVISPPKHAVRKSSVNFVTPPIRQSALPTATRSVLPSTDTSANSKSNQSTHPSTISPTLIATTVTPQPVVVGSPNAHRPSSTTSTASTTSNNTNKSGVIRTSDPANRPSLIESHTVDTKVISSHPPINSATLVGGGQSGNSVRDPSSPAPVFTTNSSGKAFVVTNTPPPPTTTQANNTSTNNSLKSNHEAVSNSDRAKQSSVIVQADSSQLGQSPSSS